MSQNVNRSEDVNATYKPGKRQRGQSLYVNFQENYIFVYINRKSQSTNSNPFFLFQSRNLFNFHDLLDTVNVPIVVAFTQIHQVCNLLYRPTLI